MTPSRPRPRTPSDRSYPGFVWAIAFHLLNGVRHLAWDVGYGFKVPTAKLTAVLVYLGSFAAVAIVFSRYLGITVMQPASLSARRGVGLVEVRHA